MSVLIDLFVMSATINCPRACTYIYDPICSYNGKEHKIFGNQCFMDAHNDCERSANAPEFYRVTDNNCNDLVNDTSKKL